MSVSARFWRLLVHRVNGGNNCGLCEWFLATSSGGPQAATGGTASAATTLGGWAPASVLFNNVTGSGTTNVWFSGATFFGGPGQTFIQYDMGVGNQLTPVEMRIAYDHTDQLYAPTAFTLWYSADGIAWTMHSLWSGEVWSSNTETKTYNITTPMTLTNQVLASPFDFREIESAFSGPSTLFWVPPFALASYKDFTAVPKMTPYTGAGFIAGSTTVLGEPARRRVDLIDQGTGNIHERVYTGPDGQFRFEYLGPGPWALLGSDITANQNSVVFAHLTPEPMP